MEPNSAMAPAELLERGLVAERPPVGRPDQAERRWVGWRWVAVFWPRARVVPLEELAAANAVQALLTRTVREISPVYAQAAVTVEDVEMSRIRPLARVMNARRRTRMKRYLRMLGKRRITPYAPAAVRFRGEATYRLALPPVLEEHRHRFAVVDGLHRLHLLFERGDATARCVVIRGAHLPELPSDLARWRAVRLSQDDSRPPKKNFPNFRSSRFRPAGSYLRSKLLQYPDLDAIRDACIAAEHAEGLVVSEHWCREHGRLDDCTP